MIVRLHNLAARRPSMADLASVTALWRIDDDCTDMSIYERMKEDVQLRWQVQGFQLAHDAWVIVNNKEEVVAYTDVQSREAEREEKRQLALTLIVHPAYRRRGIGTLLMRLVEQRSREITELLPAGGPVVLHYIAHGRDVAMKNLLAQEGFERLQHFWRVSLPRENSLPRSEQGRTHDDKLTMDLYIEASHALEGRVIAGWADSYVAQQYEVYEKVLRQANVGASLYAQAV